MRAPAVLLVLGMATWMGRPSHLQGQRRPELRVEAPDGGAHTSVLETDRGFAAVGVTELGRLGWSVLVQERTAVATSPDGIRVEVRVGTPFFPIKRGIVCWSRFSSCRIFFLGGCRIDTASTQPA